MTCMDRYNYNVCIHEPSCSIFSLLEPDVHSFRSHQCATLTLLMDVQRSIPSQSVVDIHRHAPLDKLLEQPNAVLRGQGPNYSQLILL